MLEFVLVYMSAKEKVMDQYESLTVLVRPGDYDYSTDEVEDDGNGFSQGVIEERVARYYPFRNAHVKGSGWKLYRGTLDSDYDYYIVSRESGMTTHWTAFGCDKEDFKKIKESFENNPFIIKR